MSPETAGFLTMVFSVVAVAATVGIAIRRAGEGWQTWMLIFIAKLYTGLFYQQRVHQIAPIPPGGALLIVNHRSPVDPMFILAANSRDPFRGKLTLTEFLTASEYTRLPGAIEFICRRMRAIPVDRDGEDMESAKVALRRMREGRTVGIFPEGKINFGPGLLRPNQGVGWLAVKAGLPVIPAYITGAPQTASMSMVAPFITRTKVRIDFGPPIDLSAYQGVRVTTAVVAEVTALVMKKLAEAGGLETATLKIADGSGRVSA